MSNEVIGNCAKHKGFNMINCPMCEVERANSLAINFWDNVEKDFNDINLKDSLNVLTDAIAILSAYKQDDTWSEWDESVYERMLKMQKHIYLASIKNKP